MARLNKSNINSVFFEVVERTVYWEKVYGGLFQEDKYEYTPKYKAIVDKEKETLFVIASRNYQLITNHEVLEEGKRIANLIFSDNENNNEHFKFDLYACSLGAKRASCKMILARDVDVKQPLICDAWSPVLIASNSYNKSLALRYIIGFSYHMTDLIYPQVGENFVIPIEKGSTMDFHNQINETLKKNRHFLMGLVNEAMADFQIKIERLKKQQVTNNMYLAMFCKFFNICKSKYYDQGALVSNKARSVIFKKNTFIESWNKNSKASGMNAYSFLLSILDYVTNYHVYKDSIDVYEYQLQAGKWADDYLTAASSDNFDAMSYLGDYFNTSVWLEPLTELDVIMAEREMKNLKTK